MKDNLCDKCVKKNVTCSIGGDLIFSCSDFQEDPDCTKQTLKSGGDGNSWYVLPGDATQLQDLIEHKNMNANIKDVFKACYRLGDKPDVDSVYDIEKMAYYSLRELGRILGTKDYVSLAQKLMGSQNIKEKK